jgi:hypothetical protein
MRSITWITAGTRSDSVRYFRTSETQPRRFSVAPWMVTKKRQSPHVLGLDRKFVQPVDHGLPGYPKFSFQIEISDFVRNLPLLTRLMVHPSDIKRLAAKIFASLLGGPFLF